MKDKHGNQLTVKEFFSRWKDGIAKITPLQSAKINMQGTLLMVIGILIGIISTIMSHTWWLVIILVGSLIVTLMSLVKLYQSYRIYKEVENATKQEGTI